MAHPLAKYSAFVFSRADYRNGVGFSTLQTDFPSSFSAGDLYDSVNDVQLFYGRDSSGGPLLVTGFDRYRAVLGSDGIIKAGQPVVPPFGVAPDVCSVTIEVTSAAVLADINTSATHEVYGVWNVQDGAEPDDLPVGLLPYYVLSPIPEAKRTYIINALIARGADATKVNTWFTSHPEATPRQLQQAFAQLVARVTEQAG